MSTFSMTAFGKGEASGSKYELSVEIKSVNHRFRDFRFKMSSIFNAIELDMRKSLEKKFKRGSLDIAINYKKSSQLNSFEDVDESKVEAFVKKMSAISQNTQVPLQIRPVDFLRSEFISLDDDEKTEELHQLAKLALSDAITQLEKSRGSEGEKLQKIIEKHIQDYSSNFKVVEGKQSEYKDLVSERLQTKLKEYSSELKVDEPRFLQEVIYYLEKLDVHEEINRIHVHLEKLTDLFSQKGEVGRQIDFLVQELNRETNTIGSKSGHEEISHAVVQMKVHLEKIREQALNIE